MALDFPTSPAIDQVYGVYRWDGEKWVTTGADINSKVSKTGDVMSGGLTLTYANPTISLNRTGGGQTAALYGKTNDLIRWAIQLGSNEAETGSNAGSNFTIDRHGDDGVGITNAVKINRANGLVEIAANLQAANLTAAAGVYGVTLSMSGNGSVGGSLGAGSVHGNSSVNTDGTMYAGNYIRCVNALYCGAGGVNLDNVLDGGGFYVGYMVRANPNIYPMFVNAMHVPGAWAGIRLESGGYMMDFRGDYCYTTVGGPFVAYSDERIKNVLGDYINGLDAIAALQPVRYTFKGNETDVHPANPMKMGDDGKMLPKSKEAVVVPYETSMHYGAAVAQTEFIGLVAQQAEVPMPEIVKSGKGFIDGVEVQDLRTLDTGPIVFALINAVKELKARVEELEAR